MKKYQNNTVRVIAILFMLSTAPLAVTYSYAESGENLEEKTRVGLNSLDNFQNEESRTFFTEELVNGKLELREFVIPENITVEEMQRILSLEGTLGWSYADYKKYQSGIVLFDGKSSKDGTKNWKLSVNGSLNLSKGELNLKVIGESSSSNSGTKENLSKKDLDYRVVFSGNMTESDEKNQFLIAFLNSTLENSEKSLEPQLLQIKSITSESKNSIEVNQKVRNPNLV